MALIKPSFARCDIDGTVPDDVNISLFVYQNRDDIVVVIIDNMVKVRPRRDYLGDVAADFWRIALLFNNNNGVFLLCDKTA